MEAGMMNAKAMALPRVEVSSSIKRIQEDLNNLQDERAMIEQRLSEIMPLIAALNTALETHSMQVSERDQSIQGPIQGQMPNRIN